MATAWKTDLERFVPSSRHLSMIERLPTEIIGMVYLYLDSKSFLAFVTTCPRLRDAFISNKSSIVLTYYHYAIREGVRSHAVSTHLCPHLAPFNLPAAEQFVDTCLLQEKKHLDLEASDLMEMIKFHTSVKQLAHLFLQQCAQSNPDVRQSCEKRAISSAERDRVYRALYRFEMLCRLLQHDPSRDATATGYQRRVYLVNVSLLFLDVFSPIENAQLGCVHDFLAECVLPAFNSLAEHDVSWGKERIRWGVSVRDADVQHILTMGVMKIVQFIKAKTYTERVSVVQEPPERYYHFIERALRVKSISNKNVLHILPSITPFYDDGDQGPVKAFRWAQEFAKWSNCGIYRREDLTFRRWGYVMWDEERHGALHVGMNPIYATNTFITPRLQDRYPSANMVASWNERTRLYNRGARGWWHWGNESQLVSDDQSRA